MHGIVSRLLHSSLPLNKNAFYLFVKNWTYNRNCSRVSILYNFIVSIDSYVENFIKHYYRHDEITVYRLIYNIQNSDRYTFNLFSPLFFLDREQTNGNTADTFRF